MIKLFSDAECRYPACSFQTGHVTVTTPANDRSLQYHLFEKRDGTYLLAFWLERPGYDASSMLNCRLDLSCYIPVAPEPVSFALEGGGSFGSPMLRTFETRPGAERFGHMTDPVRTSISHSGTWNGLATDTVAILSWRSTGR